MTIRRWCLFLTAVVFGFYTLSYPWLRNLEGMALWYWVANMTIFVGFPMGFLMGRTRSIIPPFFFTSRFPSPQASCLFSGLNKYLFALGLPKVVFLRLHARSFARDPYFSVSSDENLNRELFL